MAKHEEVKAIVPKFALAPSIFISSNGVNFDDFIENRGAEKRFNRVAAIVHALEEACDGIPRTHLTSFRDSIEHFFRLCKTAHLSPECTTGHVRMGSEVIQRNRLVAEMVVDVNGRRAKRANLCFGRLVGDGLGL